MNEELLDKAQEYVRTAPLKHVSDFIWWAKGVLEVREEYQSGRKKRSDAGKPRTNGQGELIPEGK